MPEIKEYTHFESSNAPLSVAIACGATGRNQNHSGLLFKNESKVEMLHFGWHKYLRFDGDIKFFQSLCYVDFERFTPENDFEDIQKKQLYRYAKRVFKVCESNIPYGISYFGDYFGSDGILHLTNDTVGLTCATFLIAFFKGFSVTLVNHDEWPPREGDKPMQEKTVSKMAETGVPQTHIDKVAAEQVPARFLPEEITASSTSPNLPASFDYCEAFGMEINKVLRG